MLREFVRSLWRRLRRGFPWHVESDPTWGDNPPTILGVCRQCGAVVLEGWHRRVENGYLCRRCAGEKG
ncbi:MAG: hypothetical protein ACUVXF_10320 [Desulfobaccales bacterium]